MLKYLFTLFVALLSCHLSFSQCWEVKGVVLDSVTNEPVPFVNIHAACMVQVAQSDFEGMFSFCIPELMDTCGFTLENFAYYPAYLNVDRSAMLEERFQVTVKQRNLDITIVSGTTYKSDYREEQVWLPKIYPTRITSINLKTK